MADWIKELEELNFTNINKVETKKEVEKFQKINELKNQIFVISYQRFVNNLKNGEKMILYRSINLIIDESQVLKSPTTKISKLALEYTSLYENLLLLSGDPISNGYENLYVQMKLLKLFPDGFSWNIFLETYTRFWVHPEHKIKIISGYKNEEDLTSSLHEKAYTLKTQDAIDLPKKNYLNMTLATMPFMKLLKK
ncbi:SNF2-related protein [Candidatus Mycoplasma pogonae]